MTLKKKVTGRREHQEESLEPPLALATKRPVLAILPQAVHGLLLQAVSLCTGTC